MPGLQTEYCVEIRVPCKQGDPDFGSGYTLGPHWVLTAHHVLFGDDADLGQPFEITWRDLSGRGQAAVQPVARDAIVWFHAEHDIALVRCPPPSLYQDVVRTWDVIARVRPAPFATCHCGGYLGREMVDEAGNPRRKTSTGTLGGFSSQESVADLSLRDVQLQEDRLWGGFSGSAVFAADNRLVAVVRTNNPGESGRGLTVSFIAPALDAEGDGPGQGRLRDVPGFLVPPGSGPCWERLCPYVIQLFNEQPAVRTSIEARCRVDQPPGTEIRDAKALAQILFASSHQKVIAYLLPTLSQAIRKQDREGIVAVEYLARVWLSLLAAGQGALPPIDGFARDTNAPPLRIEAEQPILLDVESKAAEASASEPLLQLAGDHLRSPLDLTPWHNTGLDTNGRVAVQDTKDAYVLKTRPGMEAFRAEDAKAELERHATRPETGLSRSLLPDDDQARGLAVSEQLHFDRIEYGRGFYVRIPAARDSVDASALRELHRWCPQLLVFEIDQIDYPHRRDLLSGLYRIIYRSQQFLSDPGAQEALS